MRIAAFFVSKVFLRKPVLAMGILALLLMSSYITLSIARALFSTLEGYHEMEKVNQDGFYLANLDPDYEFDPDVSSVALQQVYDYLDSNFSYALYSDGYVSKVRNSQEMEVLVSYMNEAYDDLNGFELSDGLGLDFRYDLDDPGHCIVPVLVGAGLSADYPVGTVFRMHDPALDRDIIVQVKGVIASNAAHSNHYALDSKQYYNFSIAVPVTSDFIARSNRAFKINSLMDLILMDTGQSDISELEAYTQKTIGAKFNYFSQAENNAFFSTYFISSLAVTMGLSCILFLAIVITSVWSAMVSVRATMRDLTINLLVGLSYTRLRGVFYLYHALLAGVSLLTMFGLTAWARCGFWIRRESLFATYGLFGLIRMDWLSLLVSLIATVVVVVCTVEALMLRVKKVPISVGVLQ